MAMARPPGHCRDGSPGRDDVSRLAKVVTPAVLSLALGALACATAVPACADVLEIRPDGTVVTIGAPSIVTPEATLPITVPPDSTPDSRTARPAARDASERITARPSPTIAALIETSARRHALSPDLVAAIAWQESRFRPDARSGRGALGVMQLMPATAAELGVDPADLAANIDGGAAYLRRMLNRFDGDLEKAIAAYNAGPGAVARYGAPPPFAETRGYLDAIFARLAEMTALDAADALAQDRP